MNKFLISWQYIQKEGVFLSGTMSHVIIGDMRKNSTLEREGARILITGKSTKKKLSCAET
jgi:hypothetical protein